MTHYERAYIDANGNEIKVEKVYGVWCGDLVNGAWLKTASTGVIITFNHPNAAQAQAHEHRKGCGTESQGREIGSIVQVWADVISHWMPMPDDPT